MYICISPVFLELLLLNSCINISYKQKRFFRSLRDRNTENNLIKIFNIKTFKILNEIILLNFFFSSKIYFFTYKIQQGISFLKKKLNEIFYYKIQVNNKVYYDYTRTYNKTLEKFKIKT